MVQQIYSTKADGIAEIKKQKQPRNPLNSQIPMLGIQCIQWLPWFASLSFRRLPSVLLAVLLILANLPGAYAESAASKNKEGNRLFAHEKYEDAEKAYLEAEVKNPGKPELLYNLGNSLIKQKKFDQAIQTLHQSISKGDKGIKENSWYNAGNAFFSMGKFKDSAEAFIQALRLNPADKDAKHNLELALMKLKQQEQKQSSDKQNQQKSENPKPDQPSDVKEGVQPPDKQNQDSAGKQQEQNKPSQSNRRESSFNKEQALQILDAVQNQEREEQRKLLERRARQEARGKDW